MISRSRRFLLLMCFPALLLGACVGGRMESFGQVKPGMSRTEVCSLLGEPSSRYPREVDVTGTVVRHERWQYGDTLSTLATGAVFSDLPDQRVWAVMFDDRGLVLSTREPDWSVDGPIGPPPSIVPSPNQ